MVFFAILLFQINPNGYLAFLEKLETTSILLPHKQPLLLVHLSDLTTQERGRIYYRETFDVGFLNNLTKTFKQMRSNFKPNHAVVVTWEDVPSYADVRKVSLENSKVTDAS